MSRLIILIIELLLLAAMPRRKNYAVNGLFILFAIIFSMQASSFIFSNRFITPLAFSNVTEFHAMGRRPIIYFVCSLLTIGLFAYGIKKYKNNKKTMAMSKIAFAIYIILSLTISKSTSRSLYSSIKIYLHEKALVKNFEKEKNSIINALLKDDIVYDSRSSDFIPQKKYNVIVIFTEGMSRAVISPELTPNIYDLAQRSINIRQYYNHTAATFRGLRGQLTSGFQMTGGYTDDNRGIGQMAGDKIQIKYGQNHTTISLATILADNGYTTSFQASNSINAPLSAMLSTLGFDHIYGLEDKENRHLWSIDELSDSDSYALLYDKLIQQPTPFFYGLYTIGTHIGLDSPDKQFKDGRNEYLNTFYNMDAHFGEFIKKFAASPLAENTLLIFTADHAALPTKAFMQTFNSKNEFFIDEIPLLLYTKGIHPRTIDANGLNSLSLAPTILDILGIHNGKNMFIGMSIFDKKPHRQESKISAIGTDYFTTHNGKVTFTTSEKLTSTLLKYQLLGG